MLQHHCLVRNILILDGSKLIPFKFVREHVPPVCFIFGVVFDGFIFYKLVKVSVALSKVIDCPTLCADPQ